MRTTDAIEEYICDKLCKHPGNVTSQEELDAVCAECKIEKFINDITGGMEYGN